MEALPSMANDIDIQGDPGNPSTVILSRWPDESEKDQDFQDQVNAARSNPDGAKAVEESAPDPETGQGNAQSAAAPSDEPDPPGGPEDSDDGQGAAEDAGGGDHDPEPDPEGLKCHLCDQPPYSRKGDLTKHIGAKHG